MVYQSKSTRSVLKFAPPALMLLLLAACGGDGGGSGSMAGGGGGGGGGYGGGVAAAAITISLSSANIQVGQNTTLTWSVTNATACTASGSWSGSESVTGSKTLSPTAAGTYTYTLMCTGSGAAATKSTTLTVGAAAASNGPYTSTSLVANAAGSSALTVDANLVNPWGIVFAPNASVWVANNGSSTSTLYDGSGNPQPATSPLVVTFTANAGHPFAPTGVVANATSDFVVSSGGKSGAASFIYVGEGGTIAGWSSAVNPAAAVTVYTDAGGAEYTGAALASNGGQNYLYAADFHNNKIDVFNATFVKQTPSASSFAFADPSLPAGYAPFGIQAIANGSGGATQIYVAYAQQKAPDNSFASIGAGLGLVDVFDASGTFTMRLIATGGALNAPWGIALAPADFGPLSNDLLVGNLGDGKINAFDAASGKLIGPISDSHSDPIAVPGLWGIAFGNDSANQPHNTLFFAAGTNDGSGGEYGRIDPGATPPTLDGTAAVTVIAPSATVSGTVALTAQVGSSVSVEQVEFFANGKAIGTADASPFSVQWNTTTSANGTVTLTATAKEGYGKVANSAPVTVTVNNAAPAATLTELQAQVFGPICSGCHNGVGASLPGVQNLTSAAATYASLVNVPSIEQPNLLRVKPGDPTDSYVIHKLEGLAGITGARMPFGGPYLSTATMNQIESWIAAGAQNN
ncbi:MAG: TIGR03118 family protein [Steroidobacteraceae bacterium]